MNDSITPASIDDVERSLLEELENLSEEEWSMLEQMKNKPIRAFTLNCVMTFIMCEKDTEESFEKRIVSELQKLHPRWLEYRTYIDNYDPITLKRI